MEYIFDLEIFYEVLKYIIEIIVFIVILKEIKELKVHSLSLEKAIHSQEETIEALQKHESILGKHEESIRPIQSTLYTTTDDILKLAVDFTRNAETLKAVGTIGILSDTEMKPGCEIEDWKTTVDSILPVKRMYVEETLNYINSGGQYYRVMNLLPLTTEEESIWETWANIRFFKRAMQESGVRRINLNLFHHPGIVSWKEDFHYRCSDKAVIIRVGGSIHPDANAAISITDTRVVEKFSAAYEKIISDDQSLRLDLNLLNELDHFYSVKDFQSIKRILLGREIT